MKDEKRARKLGVKDVRRLRGRVRTNLRAGGLTAGRFKGVDGLDSETEVVEYQA